MQSIKRYTRWIVQNHKRGEVLALAVLVLLASFFQMRGAIPASSELSYLEHSVLGERAGSVVPASCDSWAPFTSPTSAGGTAGSHFNGDCQTPCPTNAAFNYDPYNDPGATTCPPAPCPVNQTRINGVCMPARVQIQVGSVYPFLGVTLNKSVSASWDGDPVDISWSVTGTGVSCVGSGSMYGWTITLPSGIRTISYIPPVLTTTRTYTLKCTMPDGTSMSKSVSVTYHNSSAGSCFTSGTKVTMANGVTKPISQILPGEMVLTSKGAKKVLHVFRSPFKGALYSLNHGDGYFVTGAHPFMTREGWKSFEPVATAKEDPELVVGKLGVGDVLIKQDGSQVTLETYDTKASETEVYNLEIDEAHDYYADGYWVHNKMAL